MPSLEDALEDSTQELRGLLASLEREEGAVNQHIGGLETKFQSAQGQRKELRPVLDRRRDRRAALAREIDEIERELTAKRQALQAASEELRSAENELTECRQASDAAAAERNAAERRLEDLRAKREELEGSLGPARLRGLRVYLDDVHNALLGLARKREEFLGARKLLEDAATARTTDAVLDKRFRLRDEWRRIALRADEDEVKLDAQKRVDELTAELDSRFPGLHDAESIGSRAETEGLYFRSRGSRVRVFLPIPRTVWSRLEAGETGPSEQISILLTWALRNELPLEWDTAQVKLLEDHDLVVLDGEVTADLSEWTLKVAMGEEHCVDFLLQPIPSELEEVLRKDESHEDVR